MSNEQIQVGSPVRLKHGIGPLMMVEEIENRTVYCTWFNRVSSTNHHERVREHFHISVLKVADE